MIPSSLHAISPPPGELPFLSPPPDGGGGIAVDLALEVHRVVLHHHLVDRPPYQHRTFWEGGRGRRRELTKAFFPHGNCSRPPSGTHRTPPALPGHCLAPRPCFSRRRRTYQRRSSWPERSSVFRRASEKTDSRRQIESISPSKYDTLDVTKMFLPK